MSNPCLNIAEFRHKDPSRIRRLAHAYDNGGVCQEFLPVPHSNDFEALCRKRRSRWGVRKDFSSTAGGIKSSFTDTPVRLEFETVYDPPLGLYLELYKQGFELNAIYCEVTGAFCGRVLGNAVRHFEIKDQDIRVIRQQVDPDLVKTFDLGGIYGASSSNPLPQVAWANTSTWLETFDLESWVNENLHEHRLWDCEPRKLRTPAR